jgi:hypothetical protein
MLCADSAGLVVVSAEIPALPDAIQFFLGAVSRSAAVLAEKALLYLCRRDRIREHWVNRSNWSARLGEMRPFMDGRQINESL